MRSCGTINTMRFCILRYRKLQKQIQEGKKCRKKVIAQA